MNSVRRLVEHPETLRFIHMVYLRFLAIMRKTISSYFSQSELGGLFFVPEAQCTVFEVGIYIYIYIYIYIQGV